MTAASIMTSRLYTIKPDDSVADALLLMHRKQVRNLPVVNDQGEFIGLFGLNRLSRLLLPISASEMGRFSLSNLHFLPDESALVGERWSEVSGQPVVNFLEKKSKLRYCTPETRFPALLALLDESKGLSLPVIVLDGETRKLVGMVGAWDVLEGIVMGCLIGGKNGGESE
jgi:CBS domain-containing protein